MTIFWLREDIWKNRLFGGPRKKKILDWPENDYILQFVPEKHEFEVRFSIRFFPEPLRKSGFWKNGFYQNNSISGTTLPDANMLIVLDSSELPLQLSWKSLFDLTTSKMFFSGFTIFLECQKITILAISLEEKFATP